MSVVGAQSGHGAMSSLKSVMRSKADMGPSVSHGLGNLTSPKSEALISERLSVSVGERLDNCRCRAC